VHRIPYGRDTPGVVDLSGLGSAVIKGKPLVCLPLAEGRPEYEEGKKRGKKDG
jgi:hypothetical protein